MKQLYYNDTYLKSVMCTVISVIHTDKATEVMTDQTIFYPEGGGQRGDRGTLGPYRVLDTIKAHSGDSILILEKDCPVKQGDSFELALDWDHRYKFMVMHSAQHLLSGLMFNLYGIGTVAVHQGDDYLTIETNRSEIGQSEIDGLVMAVNDAITGGHDIIYRELSHEDAEALGMRRSIKVDGDVRVVEIVGIDRVACGGIHVANTREIRLVYCSYHEQIRGHVRLYFHCGLQALSNVLSNIKLIHNLGMRLSCRDDEIEDKIDALQISLANAKAEHEKAQRGLAVCQIKDRLEEGNVCVMDLDEGTDITPYAQAVPLFEDLAMLLLCPDNGRTKWLIALKGRYEGVDFNTLRITLLSMIDAKGGGRSPIFQGIAACNDHALLASFKEAFRKAL